LTIELTLAQHSDQLATCDTELRASFELVSFVLPPACAYPPCGRQATRLIILKTLN